MYGFPAIRSAGILSHEFMHAWMALQPFTVDSMPNIVNEGLCELAAVIYLRHARENATKDWDFALSEKILLEYEQNTDPVYGVGQK